MRLLLILVATTLLAQRTPELGIRAKDASTTGTLYLEDLTGNRINNKAPGSVTAYTLTWPASISAGCLTASGGGTLTWQSCVSLPIDDSVSLLKDNVNTTALARFELSAVTPGATRVATFPNYNFIMAAKDVDTVFSSTQTFSVSARTPEVDIIPTGGGSPGFLTFYESTASGVNLSGFQGASSMASNCIYIIGDTSLLPCVDNHIDLGSGSFRFKKGWLQSAAIDTTLSVGGNLSLSGNIAFSLVMSPLFSGLGSIGTALLPYGVGSFSALGATSTFRLGTSTTGGYCLVADASGFGTWQSCPVGAVPVATQFVTGTVSTTTQSFGGDKTFYGSVLPGSSGTYSSGTISLPWANVSGKLIEVADGFGAAYKFSSSSNTLVLRNPSLVNVMQIDAGLNQFLLRYNLLPWSGGQNIGDPSLRWNTFYGTNIDMPSSGNATLYVGSGNMYLRVFAGSPSCSGPPVADGWVGFDTFNDRLWICRGGIAKYAQFF